MSLQTVSRSRLNLRPISWAGLSRRFINESELETIIALIASVRPRGVLEFGVNTGRTAKAILANVPGINCYQGIDVTPGYVCSKPVQRNEVPTNPGEMVLGDGRFELIVRPRGSLDLQASDLAACDAAFIDGDHGREAVLHDYALSKAAMRPGGIVIFHDYHELGNVDVREVVQELAGTEPICHVAGTWIAFQRL